MIWKLGFFAKLDFKIRSVWLVQFWLWFENQVPRIFSLLICIWFLLLLSNFTWAIFPSSSCSRKVLASISHPYVSSSLLSLLPIQLFFRFIGSLGSFNSDFAVQQPFILSFPSGQVSPYASTAIGTHTSLSQTARFYTFCLGQLGISKWKLGLCETDLELSWSNRW